MKRFKTWTLTDVAHDVWVDDFTTSALRMGLGPGQDWAIAKRTLRGGLRDGIDLIEVDNGALSFAVLPTRGMGLWQGSYKGLYLGWKAPLHGPVHPKFVNTAERGGIGWLTGFDEWLCRCGLAWNGPPGEDVHTDRDGTTHRERLSLHGRIANQPAHHVEVQVALDPPFELTVRGQVEEAGLFYPHLELTTSYTTVPGSNRLVIHDLVRNRGARPAEFQVLYHCNLGQPFLEAGSRVLAPIREVCPLTPRAAEGMATLETYAGPQPGFAEQVYAYDLLADGSNRTLAMLHDASSSKGVVLRFDRSTLPCFTVWKNTMALEEGFVTGLEPATNYPNFKTYERQQGRVVLLPPGGQWETSWSIEVHADAHGVAETLKEIVTLQSQAKALLHPQPMPRFSAAAAG